MLEINPEERLYASQLLLHEVFTSGVNEHQAFKLKDDRRPPPLEGLEDYDER
jgi:hypothetical protein